MKKYHRKFLVPGDSLKKDFFLKHCKECEAGKWTKNSKGHSMPPTCRGLGGLYFPYNTCIHKDELFNEYIVGETEDGKWQCSCKGWIFKYKKTGEDCAHIRKAKANPEKYEVDVNWTGKAIETIKKVTG